LSVEEVEKALSRSPLGALDHADVLEYVKQADTNGDGVIDFSEFVEAWRAAGAGGAVQASQALRRGLSMSGAAQDMDIDADAREEAPEWTF